MSSACERALQIFRDRDFATWRGLPDECDLETIYRVLPPVVDAEAVGMLGAFLPRRFRMVQAPGYPRNIRVWFDGPRAVALEAGLPQLHRRLSETLSGWGEPEAKLDYMFDVLTLRQAEWVYAGRGLAAAINPDNQIALRIVVFAPTTLDRYLAEIRPPSGVREHPE
jgi:hypothetical protein